MSRILKAGDRAPEDGIYRVTHYQHRMPHTVAIRQGTLLPRCIKCGDHVSFDFISGRSNDGDLECDSDFNSTK